MEEEKIEIIDQSGDKSYFTIIPNYILNHSTANTQALYLQLKRLAGDVGVAYPSSRYLRRRLKISQPTLRNGFKYLLEKKWIKCMGEKEVETDGGKQKIKSYKIVNLWNMNSSFYTNKGSEKIDTPKSKRGSEKIGTPKQRGERIDTKGVKARGERIGTKEDPSEEDPSIKKNVVNKVDKEVFSLKEKLQLMEKDKNRHIQIIALYWKFKEFNYENEKQYQSAIVRSVRASKKIVGYSDKRISEVMAYLENENTFKWTLETVEKYIDEKLNRIKPIV